MSRQRLLARPGAPLTPPVFYILLSLSTADRHGYDILKHVEDISSGAVRLSPGTLYTNLNRLLEASLITEVQTRPARDDDPRRRYYRLTRSGRKELAAERDRMKLALELAHRALGATS
jgi:DNA-binding PadR family transcriptional regulator